MERQITKDLEKFATRQTLANINPAQPLNVKEVVYRSTTILISEMGRLHKIHANSCFDILRKLTAREEFSEAASNKIMFAVSLACLARLKWYMLSKRQNDIIDSIQTFVNLIGKQATFSYFRIAYALQCDISKRSELKKIHLYSNPCLFNISLAFFVNDYDQMHDLLQNIQQTENSNQR